MRDKSEVPLHARKFIASFAALLNKGGAEPQRLVGTLYSENASEFLSTRFTELLADSGVRSSTCPPHVHELNGVAESAIRSIMEPARYSLVAASAPTIIGTSQCCTPLMSSTVLQRRPGALRLPLSWSPATSRPS
eukprot:6172719-Pleurochrysis_carterae.AAC.6